MKKHNKIALTFLILMFAVSLKAADLNIGGQAKADSVPLMVRQAAIKGLPGFLNAIPQQDLGLYNFSDKKEFEQVILGNPLKMYTITPENIFGFNSKTQVEEILSPTSVWLFPVILKGKTVTLLTVDFINGKWKAVSLGSSGLAKQLNDIMKQFPLSEGYSRKFVRIFQAKADFLFISKNGKISVMPLESARFSLDLNKGQSYVTPEIISNLRQVVRDNIDSAAPNPKIK